MNKQARTAERGNVLFYILIAIALMAALSFAVSQSNQGSVSIVNEEKARLIADEMLDYGNTIANAVAQLRLRGCKDTEISFKYPTGGTVNPNAPPDNSCHIFEKAGGGVVYRSFFLPNGSVNPTFQTGTQAIEGFGTDDAPDIWMRILMDGEESSHRICTELNESVDMAVINDMSTAGFEPVEDGTWTSVNFAGVYPAAVATDRPDLEGRPAWCAGHNVTLVSFYRLLLAR